MDKKIELIEAYQLSVSIIEMSLGLIEKWACDTALLEEILRINHRGWELFLKASCFIFAKTIPKNDSKFRRHYLCKLLPKLQLDYGQQNLNQLFQSKMFRDYFQLLDNLFAETKSRYNVIDSLLGEGNPNSFYVVDQWIKAQKLHLEKDWHELTRKRILEINMISLRCFYMNMPTVPELCSYRAILNKWSSYYHEWFLNCEVE